MKQVRIVHPHERDTSTAQTAGMVREAGVAASTVGAFVILRRAGWSVTAGWRPKDLAVQS